MTNPFDQFDTPAANANPFDQFDAPGAKKPVEGGLLASVKQTVGSTIKGAGQLASDVGVADKDNALTRTGQGIIDANPTAVHSLGDIVDSPWTATKEAVGNAGASVGGVLGARALGMGITAAAPLAGPAAPVVALAGQALSWLGPAAIAALPSYGGIRDKQILNDPANQEDGYAKAKAALGAAAVGAIEARFGPQNWAAAMLTKEGRAKAAEMFASTTMKGAVGKGLLQGALVEGAEELVQNPVEQLAAGDDPLTAESLKDTAFSGAMGAIGGGVAGGGVRGAQHLVAPSPKNPITDANTFEEAHAAFQFDVDSNRPVLDLAEMAKSYKDHTPEELVAQQRELLRAVSGNPEYVIGEDGTHTFNGAPLKVVAAQELPLEGEGLTRHAYEAISALNEAQGKRTVVYANDERLPDGMAQQPDVAFVSSHTTFDPAVVVAHEVQHLSEEGDKQAEFARIVKEELTTQAQDLAIQRHGKLADDRLHQEIRGDIAGDALADPTFHTRVITKMQEQLGEKEAESHAQAFLASIKGLIDRIKAILTGKTFTTPDGERLASQYVKDLQRVHDALAAAVAAQFIKQGYETGAKVRADAKLARTAVGRTIAEAAKALPQTEVAHAQDVMTEILANPGEIFKKARERIAIDTRPEVGKAIAAMDADPNAIFEIARTQPAILKTIAAVASERVNAQPKAEPVKEEPAKPAPDTRPDVAAGVKSMTPDHVNLVALALKRGTGLEETIAKAQTDLGKLEAEKKKVEAARAKTKSDEKVKVESKRAKEKVAPKDEGATSEVKLSPKSDKIEAARATNQGTYLNVGLSTAELRGPGTFLHQSEVERAIKALGVGVIRTTTAASKTEPTAVVRIDRPLTIAQLDALSVTLHQEAIPQLHNGSGIMGGPKASAWGPFNPDFFYMPNGKTMSKNASPFAKNSALARAVPATLDDVSSMAAAVALARGQKFATGRDFKLALQARVQAAAEAAKVDLTEDTPEVRNYIRRSMLREVQDGIRTNANAIGWYDEKVTKALRVLSLLHPEIVTDPESKFAFIWALAVTSNGMKVNKNFVLAERAYASWKRSGGTKGGKFDEVGEGPTKKKINDGLNSYRTMMDKYGYAALSKTMLSQASVREIQKATGIKPSGEGMNEILFGASILGPKIGNGFFMNLNGEFGQLTMDRWWQRMWGRLTGTLVIEDKQKVLKSKDQFLSLVRLISSDPETKKVVEQTLAAKLVTGDAIGTAEAIQRATMGEEVRLILQDAMPASDDAVYTQLVSIQGQPAKGKEFLSVGDELRKAALRYLKNIDGQKEAPTAEDRRMMRSIAQQVLVEVQKTNPDITMADMQAILWYPEKRVYDAAGLDETGEEGYEDSEAPDYANAAVRLARDNGISQERINQAVSEADNDIQARKRAGRSGREPGRLSAAGEAGEGTAGEVSAAGSEAGARTESGEVDGQTRSDARGRGPARASPKSRLLPAHGAARPDGVDVFGTHYSRAERSSLASSAYGTGYRGAEYARVQAAIDDRLRHRVYFYVDTGKGINPEGGVGSVPHGAKLNGLYDIGHDPLDLYARAHEAARESGTDVMNAFESALLDAGFDGYFTREYAKQGAAVLLGNRAVQVAKLDEPIGEVAPAMAPFTGPKLRAREIMADRSLPAGQMSGERWMKLVPDAKLDADRLYYKDGVARSVMGLTPELKASPKQETFYSELSTRVEGSASKAMPAKMWKDWIRGLLTKGVKQAELDATGVNEWLDLQEGKVTREALAEYLEQNGVQVEEVMLNDSSGVDAAARSRGLHAIWERTKRALTVAENTAADTAYGASIRQEAAGKLARLRGEEDAARREYFEDRDKAQATIEENRPTKFASYQLPGGKNYRELLLTLPEKEKPTFKYQVIGAFPGEFETREAAQKHIDDMTGHSKRPGLEGLGEAIERHPFSILEQERNDSRPSSFIAPHFSEHANILAHVRFNARTDAEGKRVLFLEEIQSDWAQTGKKSGFKADDADAKEQAARKAFHDATPDQDTAPLKRAVEEATEAARGVPSAPFVTKTEAWVGLALKRMIKYAADNGFDKIAWTTGEQQAARYDLSKTLTKVTAVKKGDQFQILGVDQRGDSHDFGVHAVDKLDDVVGKDLAKKIAAQETPNGVYAGNDLKVGGEGMKTFYDKIVPNVANSLVKKYGLRVGEIKIDQLNNAVERERGDRLFADVGGSGWMKQPGFDVTPSMAGKQVLFSPKSPAFKKWFGDSKVVDERGEPLVVYHGTDRTFDKFDIKAKRAHIMFTEKDPQGFYFTKNAGWAYAGGGDGDRVIPAYLRITSPLRTERGSHEHVIVPKARMLELKAKGYDGIIYDEGDEIVVFSPDQIKSVFNPDATGGAKFSPKIVGASNRTYTPEQRHMFEKVGRTVDVPTFQQRIASLRKDMGKKLAQGIVDQFAPLKELSPMAYMLARLSKGTAGAFEAMLHHGKLRLNAGAYDADRSGGFIENVGIPLQGEMEDFLWYVAANRAERLSAQDRERLFSASDIAAGKSLANGNLTFDYTLANGTVTRSRRQAYEDSVKKFDAFNKNALDMAEQSGLIDPASRKIWEHEFYVPFYRVSEEDGSFVGAKIGNGLVRQRAFKQLKGGTDKLNSDLLANTLANWAHLIDAGAKNRAAKSALEAAASMGVAVEADAATVKAMGQAIGKKNATVWFVEGGVQRHFLVDDPFVLTAITSLEYSGMKGPLMDAMSAFKHWLTVGVTASPVFKVKNLIRDSVQAVATSPLSANIPGNIRQGIAASDHSTQNYVSALASGGLIRFGTMLEGRTADRVRQLVKSGIKDTTILNSNAKVQAMYDKYLEPAIAAYNELGNRSEEITRSALFEQLKAKGMDHATAALMARDLMDFSLQGSWTGIRFLTQVVPFMNARLQGMYKLGRAATEDPKRMAAVIGATTLFSLSLLAAYGGDDDWKKREDWDRDNFWWFKLGGVAFRIPKPFEIGAVATLAERGFEYFTDKEMTGKRFTDRTLKLLGDNLSMNPVPQMVKPILDVYANKNGFTGRPIETLGMENLAPDYRYTSRTSMLARGASTAGQSVTSLVGGNFLSPVQIDSMLQGYFSWLGSFVVGASEIVARPATGQAERPAGDPWKFATGGLITELPADQSRYVSHMYEQSKIVEQAMGTYRDLVKQGRRAEAAEFLAEHREDVTKYKATEAVKKAESKLNERVRMVERSAKSPEEKKALISAIREQQDRIARIVK